MEYGWYYPCSIANSQNSSNSVPNNRPSNVSQGWSSNMAIHLDNRATNGEKTFGASKSLNLLLLPGILLTSLLQTIKELEAINKGTGKTVTQQWTYRSSFI